MRSGHSLKRRKAWCHCEWFVQEGRLWRRHTERVEEVCWTEEEVRDAEYRHHQLRFIVALLLTIPVALLAMGGHILPSLEKILNFPGRPWNEKDKPDWKSRQSFPCKGIQQEREKRKDRKFYTS